MNLVPRHGFLNSYGKILEKIGLDWRDWLVFYFLVGFVTPLVLMVVYMSTASHLFETPFYLDYSSPTVLSMFLSAYSHYPFIHLWTNIFIFEEVLMATTGWLFFMVPVAVYSHPTFHFRFSAKTLWAVTLMAFLISPFMIGIFSTIVGNLTGKAGGYGFSGIIYVFIGYSMVLVQQAVSEKRRILMYTRPWLAWQGCVIEEIVFVVPLIIIALDSTMMPGSNIVGHGIGYLMGWFGTQLIDRGNTYSTNKEID
jgi:hypothetical protein